MWNEINEKMNGKRQLCVIAAGKPVRALAVLLAVTVLFCGISVAAAKKAPGPVGFVSAVKGKALLIRGKAKPRALDGMNALLAGDAVEVKANGSVTVNLCAKGGKTEVRGAAAFTVSAGGLKFKNGKAGKKTTIKKGFCETLAASASKYDRAAMKEEVAESVGAMSVMGFISAKSAGGSGGSLADILGEETGGSGSNKSYELDEPAVNMRRAMEQYDTSMEYNSKALADDSYGGVDDWGNMPVPEPVPDMGIYGEDKIYKPDAVYSENTVVYDIEVFSRPSFTGTSCYGSARYEVKIINAVNVEIMKINTSGQWIDWPADASPLLPGGWYLAEITAYDSTGLEYCAELTGLSVKNSGAQAQFDAEEKQLRELSASQGGSDVMILLGRFYKSNGYKAKAIEYFNKALAIEPGNESLQSQVDELKGNIEN